MMVHNMLSNYHASVNNIPWEIMENDVQREHEHEELTVSVNAYVLSGSNDYQALVVSPSHHTSDGV